MSKAGGNAEGQPGGKTLFPHLPYDLATEVVAARNRIGRFIRRTPLIHSRPLSGFARCNVYLKLECLQHTGTFKFRGAMNKLQSLPSEVRAKGAVAASTGNHGLAVAYALSKLGCDGAVFVPETTAENRVVAIEDYGVKVFKRGPDSKTAQSHARAYATEQGMTFLPPYNDPMVVAGQGTAAYEIHEQCDAENIDAVFACLGGGGMISGITGYLKALMPDVKSYGCSPANSPGMIACLEAGEIVGIDRKPTLADGSNSGSIVPGAITFDLCRKLVDRTAKITEEEIASALATFVEQHHILIDASAAVAVAGFYRHAAELRDKNVVIIICGSNIPLDVVSRIFTDHLTRRATREYKE